MRKLIFMALLLMPWENCVLATEKTSIDIYSYSKAYSLLKVPNVTLERDEQDDGIKTQGREPEGTRPFPSANRYAVVKEGSPSRGGLRLVSAFCGDSADNRFHGTHLPPQARRQVYAEGVGHQRKGGVVETDGAAHAGHA